MSNLQQNQNEIIAKVTKLIRSNNNLWKAVKSLRAEIKQLKQKPAPKPLEPVFVAPVTEKTET